MQHQQIVNNNKCFKSWARSICFFLNCSMDTVVNDINWEFQFRKISRLDQSTEVNAHKEFNALHILYHSFIICSPKISDSRILVAPNKTNVPLTNNETTGTMDVKYKKFYLYTVHEHKHGSKTDNLTRCTWLDTKVRMGLEVM